MTRYCPVSRFLMTSTKRASSIAGTRDAARQDVFDYIEMFDNPKLKHTNNGMLSPVDFETQQQKMKKAGV